MNTYEKVKVIKNYLNSRPVTEKMFTCGWDNLCDLYMKNNLSYEFMLEVEKEIDSIYDLICKSKASEKETRIPALHTKGTLHRFSDNPTESPYPRHFLRVNDDSKKGFTDYAITNYDLEVMILDSSAEFVKNDRGNFLDYSEEAMRPAELVQPEEDFPLRRFA